MNTEKQKIQSAIDRIIPVGIRDESYAEKSAQLISDTLAGNDAALDAGVVLDILVVFENRAPKPGALPVSIESFTSYPGVIAWAERDTTKDYFNTITGQSEDGSAVTGYRWWTDDESGFTESGGADGILINADDTEENTYVHLDMPPYTKEAAAAYLEETNWHGERFEIVEL